MEMLQNQKVKKYLHRFLKLNMLFYKFFTLHEQNIFKQTKKTLNVAVRNWILTDFVSRLHEPGRSNMYRTSSARHVDRI